MKCIKFLLILSVFFGVSSMSYANFLDDNNPCEIKLNLSGANDVAAKANKSSSGISSPYSQFLQDPMMNSAINGMGNMLQGATGGSYSATEQAKQQLEYAKQQVNYSK